MYFYAFQHNFPTLALLLKQQPNFDTMKKILLLIIPLFIFTINVTAQDSIQVKKNTLKDQIDFAYTKSNSYQEYKVIKKTLLANLRKNILDSVALLETNIKNQKTELALQRATIDSLTLDLKNTQQALATSKKKEDGIELLGVLTQKTTYNTIMWSIIGLLLLVGGFLFYRFMNSHKITNATELKMAEIEIELEDYRRNSLEREQKLRRKLQDEVNKNRKV